MKTVAEVAKELSISAVTINKYKNKTLNDQLATHFFKEFRAGKEVSVIDDEGIEIIRKRKEAVNSANEDDDNPLESDISVNEPLKTVNNDYIASDNKLLQTIINGLQQQINSLQQQLTVKDKQLAALSEQLAAANNEIIKQNEGNRQSAEKLATLVDNEQRLTAAILRSPRLKIDTAYLAFEQPDRHQTEYSALLVDQTETKPEKKTFWNKVFNK